MRKLLDLFKNPILSKHIKINIWVCFLYFSPIFTIAQVNFDTVFIGKTTGIPKISKKVIGDYVLLLESDKKKYPHFFKLHSVNTKSKEYQVKKIELPQKIRGKIENFKDFYFDHNDVCYLLYDDGNLLILYSNGSFETLKQKDEYNHIQKVQNDTVFLSFSGYQQREIDCFRIGYIDIKSKKGFSKNISHSGDPRIYAYSGNMIDFDGEYFYQANALDYQIKIFDKKLNLVDSILGTSEMLKQVEIDKNITEVIDLIYYLVYDFDKKYTRISGLQRIGKDTLYVVFSSPSDSLTNNYIYTVDAWVRDITGEWKISKHQMNAKEFYLDKGFKFYASLIMFNKTFQNSGQYFGYRYSCTDLNTPINQCLDFNHYIIYNIDAFAE